jgi:hypothetical protein
MMGQILHGGATTTEAVRRAIQHSRESLRKLGDVMGSTGSRCRCFSAAYATAA